jgi:MFS family permease
LPSAWANAPPDHHAPDRGRLDRPVLLNSTLVFFLTWFPSYLAEERGMTFIKSGWLVSLPYIGASLGVLLGGRWSDWLIRFTGSPTIGRKVPIITGLLLCSSHGSGQCAAQQQCRHRGHVSPSSARVWPGWAGRCCPMSPRVR